MSCRDFVRNILPQLQSNSPQSLGGAAEAVLEDEIGNEKACVVSGDGQETASGMQEVNEELGNEEGERTESDSGDDTVPKTYPSWRRSQVWSPTADDTAVDDSDTSGSETESIPSSAYGDTTVLRRIKSALSVVLPVRARNHRRTPSYQSLHNEPNPTKQRLSISSLASITSVPPSPSIRRSSTSHPNITSLVQQWTSSGPANQTLTFKPS